MKPTLAERLRKSVAAAGAPSLVPKGYEPQPPEKEEEVIPDLREVTNSPAIQAKILRLVAESLEWQRAEKEARDSRKPITDDLKAIIPAHCSANKFLVDGNRVSYFGTKRKTINAGKLLSAGISPQVIAACTDTTESYSLKISPAGVTEED